MNKTKQRKPDGSWSAVAERVGRAATPLFLVRVALLTILIAAGGCQSVKPQKGGAASTSISQPGHTNTVMLAQSDNPKEPSTQTVQSEQTMEYVIPAGSLVPLGCPPNPVAAPARTASPTPELTRPYNAAPVPPSQDSAAFALVQQAVPVKLLVKDRTETSIGGAQRDTLREWAGKAANAQPVMWAGIAMMTLVAGAFVYFHWWTKAAVAIAIGLGMIVLAQTLPDHGTLILLGGVAVFGVSALLVLYSYYKGQWDQNQNGIPDFLETKNREGESHREL
jgi:hypothetical protein